MDKKYSNITWETPDSVIEGTPVNDIPREVIEYYMSHEYMERGIPLSADTCREIAKIFNKGAETK